jgi:hypothetical protein
VTEHNWTFRLPWPADALDAVPDARERQAVMAGWTERHQRVG